MRRDRAAEAEAAERQRAVRERLDATGSGLAELELLRQRQEELVRAALQLREEEQEEQEERREAPLSSEEKLLEENILLLRKQLNCLRRRDAGLISQLQELDRQISDLRLDTETPHDPPETDSRPSSGFYELSDGASGSLSNSSNSVFSECFCSTAEADGRLPPADELACSDCDGSSVGLWDDSSSCGTVRRSLSAPHPAGLDAVSSTPCDSQSRFHYDLVSRNGSDVYRYPSPLHAVAVQSPNFLQMLGPGRDDGPVRSEGPKPESLPASVSAPLVSQSCSCPAPSSSSSSSSSQTASQKRLDSYIFSLLQRRALPVRTSRPRTSISTDPSKSVLRQASLCVRQGSGPGLGTLRGSEFKPSWLTGGAEGAASSPQRSVESKPEDQENRSADSSRCAPSHGVQTVTDRDFNTKLKSRRLPASAASSETLPTDLRELGRPKANSSPKESEPPCFFPDQELLKSPPVIKTSCTAGRSPKPPQTAATEKVDRSAPESVSLCSSSLSQEGEGAGSRMENAVNIPAQRQNIKLHKTAAVKTTTMPKTSRVSEHGEVSERRGDKSRHRSGSKKSQRLEDGGSISVKVSKRAAGGTSSRIKRLPASIPEGRVLDKNATSTPSGVRSAASRHHHHHHHHHQHHHHHGRDQVAVVAKPKHKRNDYRRLRAIMEVPYDEAFRRAQRRQRKELLSRSADVFLPAAEQASSPYACVAGSDSEYSAECASLFHSTIADTSEDESNYTTNRFGDSESSEDEYVEESSTSDTEESGGGGAGGAGRGRSQLAPAGARGAGQEMTPAQAKAFVKIKASHTLKKKILRFRSGSLKLMTTV